MKRASDKRRVLLAITETSSLSTLWRVVTQQAEGEQTELVTVFVCDDRWHRAASLPFTREISRVSGSDEDFTRQRATAIHEDHAGRARERLSELAAEAKLQHSFAVLSQFEAGAVRQVVRVEQDVLIAPAVLEDWPVFAELARLNRRVLIVDSDA